MNLIITCLNVSTGSSHDTKSVSKATYKSVASQPCHVQGIQPHPYVLRLNQRFLFNSMSYSINKDGVLFHQSSAALFVLYNWYAWPSVSIDRVSIQKYSLVSLYFASIPASRYVDTCIKHILHFNHLPLRTLSAGGRV